MAAKLRGDINGFDPLRDLHQLRSFAISSVTLALGVE
jgi:hypothetical protein